MTAVLPSTARNYAPPPQFNFNKWLDPTLRECGNQAELRQSRVMFQPRRLLSALKGVRHYVLDGFKSQQDTAQRVEGLESPRFEQSRQAGPELRERAIHRLMSRAEIEMSHPEAVQRRESIAKLKLAAASMRQSARPPS